jgi:ParB-like chromosome segregation protein Spo0J
MSKDQFKSFGMEPCVLSLTDITPYARNSRTHSDSQIAEIAASIKEFGWRQPIVIDDGNTIRAGHGRFLAAQRLGLKEVPCLRGRLTESQWRAYVIADNRLAEKAGWDVEMLKLEVEDLEEDNFNVDLTGFLQEDLKKIFIDDEPVKFEPSDKEPERLDRKKAVTCPSCGEEFEPKD